MIEINERNEAKDIPRKNKNNNTDSMLIRQTGKGVYQGLAN